MRWEQGVPCVVGCCVLCAVDALRTQGRRSVRRVIGEDTQGQGRRYQQMSEDDSSEDDDHNNRRSIKEQDRHVPLLVSSVAFSSPLLLFSSLFLFLPISPYYINIFSVSNIYSTTYSISMHYRCSLHSCLSSPTFAPLFFLLFHFRLLPTANIIRIMKRALPGNVKVAKDAKLTVQECVSEYISFITSEYPKYKYILCYSLLSPPLFVSSLFGGIFEYLKIS